MDSTDTLPSTLTPDTVRTLAGRSVRRESAAAFQALLAASSEAVRALRKPLADASSAALSLRQRETVEAVASDLRDTLAALDAGVSDQARCLGRRRTSDIVRALRPTPGWLPRLRERAADFSAVGSITPTWVAASATAVDALGQTAEHVATLAAAQPAPSSAHRLGQLVADHLRAGRDALLADVARLVD
ncbi:MAG: hypothetical protein AAGK21_10155 [Bacteroidota bacterium]